MKTKKIKYENVNTKHQHRQQQSTASGGNKINVVVDHHNRHHINVGQVLSLFFFNDNLTYLLLGDSNNEKTKALAILIQFGVNNIY
ncbi:hypothetical protein DERP_011986 [Dermatophagoides pteronyssinus]|uniref:Uncharacterized protein n=1 Tax=Dermatophagoides pteronyssinus TaxID=6956 RepID=A0ABQ8IVM7_DERPT|nr:hypothetical protein DERP_011986 [Dermatophagoides pteronyssinus]